MKILRGCVGAVVAAFLCAGALRAETETEYQNRPPASVTQPPAARLPAFAPGAVANVRRLTPQEREERAFLRQAAAFNRFHADAARMMMVKSSDPGLRELALSLLDQREVIGNELLRLLHQRGMAAPMLDNADRKTLNRLGRLPPRRFDRELLDALARSTHEETQAYDRASLALDDPALHAWIAGKLPTLRSSLAQVQQVGMPAPATRTPRVPAQAKRLPPGRSVAPVAAHPSESSSR